MGTLAEVYRLIRTIECLQEEEIQCPSCFIYFTKKWCKNKETSCFFCINFIASRDTYNSIIENIDWYYINSDEYDHALYCREFKKNLKKWISEFPTPKLSLSSWLFL